MPSSHENGEKKEGHVQSEEEKEREELLRKQQEIKIIPESSIQSLLVQHNHTLQNISKAAGKGGDEGKLTQIKKVKVKLTCTSLILSDNKIPHLDNLYKVVDQVMFDSNMLCWLDLSHNYLTNISDEMSKFPNLRTLNLHRNYIYKLEDFIKLQKNPQLKSLTVHGNPIDTIAGFRIYIIGLVPTLKRLDTVLISVKERDNAKWIPRFVIGNGKLPQIKEPPPPPVEAPPQKKEEHVA